MLREESPTADCVESLQSPFSQFLAADQDLDLVYGWCCSAFFNTTANFNCHFTTEPVRQNTFYQRLKLINEKIYHTPGNTSEGLSKLTLDALFLLIPLTDFESAASQTRTS